MGMVTSRPFHTKPELYDAVVKWAQADGEVNLESGQFVDPQWAREFWLSVGRTEEEIQADLLQPDVRVTYKGVSAFAGASHWQFLAWKQVLQEFLPIDLSKPLGQVLKLDEMINERGYLRLMTDCPYTMNLSNTVELPDKQGQALPAQAEQRPRLADLPIIKSPLMRLYNGIFKLYYKK